MNILILLGKAQKPITTKLEQKKKFIKEDTQKLPSYKNEQTSNQNIEDLLFSSNNQIDNLNNEPKADTKKGFAFIKKEKENDQREYDFLNNAQSITVNQNNNFNITVFQQQTELKEEKKGFGFVKKNNNITDGVDELKIDDKIDSNKETKKQFDLSDILSMAIPENQPEQKQNDSNTSQNLEIPFNQLNQNPLNQNNQYYNYSHPQSSQYVPNQFYNQSMPQPIYQMYQQPVYNGYSYPQYPSQYNNSINNMQPQKIQEVKDEKKEDKLKLDFLNDMMKPKN